MISGILINRDFLLPAQNDTQEEIPIPICVHLRTITIN